MKTTKTRTKTQKKNNTKKTTHAAASKLHLNELSRNNRTLSIDYSTTSENVQVVMRDVKSRLIQKLNDMEDDDMVYGCVAWLTDRDILKALVGKSFGIVIQKNDALPDHVLQLYQDISHQSMILENGYFEFDTLMGRIDKQSTFGDVRCIGFDNCEDKKKKGGGKKETIKPYMHHKFLVFAKQHRMPETERRNIESEHMKRFGTTNCTVVDAEKITPYAVWTGSFNFTNNANGSVENAVFIQDEKIAEAYTKEWANLYFNSEPLDTGYTHAVMDPYSDFPSDNDS